jgi:hypothetical protein
MQQIRISSNTTASSAGVGRFDCEWMEACTMNQWFLKARLAEALAAQGPGSHRIESRDKPRAEEAVPVG